MSGRWMEQEILSQPSHLAAAADRYRGEAERRLGGRRFDMVVLAARGSSDHAALFARYLIEIHLGIPAILAAPSVLTRYHRRVRYANALCIGISQSGSAPDVSEVVASMREDGHASLAVTNTAGSNLADAAEETLLLAVGEERSVAATKTYTASLLALFQIVRALGGDLPEPELPTDAWSERCRTSATRASAVACQASPLFALGRGYGFCTAHETALKLMECALLPCKAYSSADFEHGPRALAGPGSGIIAFEGVADSIRRQGGDVVDAPKAPVADSLQPLWQTFFGQWVALECARNRGEDPDQPRFITKVTETF